MNETLGYGVSAEVSSAVSPVEVYESGLDSQCLWVLDRRGHRRPVPVSDWSGLSLPGDASLLRRCVGATLDIGCGPGRLVAALAAAGRDALGIDVSAGAISRTCAAGGNALRRSVFGSIPGKGRWDAALLADGNIGIGGDPEALLRRTRELLAPAGVALVECAPPGAATTAATVRLQDADGRVSEWFPWAEVGVDGVSELALRCDLVVSDRWQSAGRWFVQLSRHQQN